MTSLEARDAAFYLAGKEIMVLSGAMHYFRVVPEYWKDRMIRMKACGLNTLETYVPWNLHEEVRGEFSFEGILDVRKYIQTAQEVGLHVIFRPGPYICSEWEFGGLPSWLLSDPEMAVRSSYQPYLDAVDRFFSKLLPLVADLQYSAGGPIIAVQLENEYGAYGDDMVYKVFLKQIMEKSGIKELLFTSDNGMGIQKGEIPGVLMTVNYQEIDHGHLMYEYLRNVKQRGKPLMVMEFWTGWFDHWASKHEIWPTEKFEEVLRWILKQKSSVNFYMMHGGTNFGFMNGANQDLGATNTDSEPYAATITSYDYDAPISENGDIAPKGHKIREIFLEMIKPFLNPDLPDMPADIVSEGYGDVSVKQHLPFSELISHIEPIESIKPVTMETLDINNGGGQSYGYILYRTTIHQGRRLTITGTIRDRAQILLGGREVAVLDSTKPNQTVELPVQTGPSILDILVENQGRVNYAGYKSSRLNTQRKGLKDKILLDNTALEDWKIYPIELKNNFITRVCKSTEWREGSPPAGLALVSLNLNITSKPADTYINMKGWTKGVVFINGFNLGRYWKIGPQETLYIPAPLLKLGDNQILIFEQHSAHSQVTFDSVPTLGETIIHKTWI